MSKCIICIKDESTICECCYKLNSEYKEKLGKYKYKDWLVGLMEEKLSEIEEMLKEATYEGFIDFSKGSKCGIEWVLEQVKKK